MQGTISTTPKGFTAEGIDKQLERKAGKVLREKRVNRQSWMEDAYAELEEAMELDDSNIEFEEWTQDGEDMKFEKEAGKLWLKYEIKSLLDESRAESMAGAK